MQGRRVVVNEQVNPGLNKQKETNQTITKAPPPMPTFSWLCETKQAAQTRGKIYIYISFRSPRPKHHEAMSCAGCAAVLIFPLFSSFSIHSLPMPWPVSQTIPIAVGCREQQRPQSRAQDATFVSSSVQLGMSTCLGRAGQQSKSSLASSVSFMRASILATSIGHGATSSSS
ncbi:hypothetical protein VTK56DRAFT_674 [Thermocarpiscus australiensis]